MFFTLMGRKHQEVPFSPTKAQAKFPYTLHNTYVALVLRVLCQM